ncbi:hypothetical protein Salat_1025200 [Sesamum alatum]|uniref:Uncharacterized protein n=1 Tax=Sesamum alatum TaxID=300844 RepID=A0AAE1YLI9_9LAMI|nr:hypothetical protein Salat_1025200 [Sesamum alatum]
MELLIQFGGRFKIQTLSLSLSSDILGFPFASSRNVGSDESPAVKASFTTSRSNGSQTAVRSGVPLFLHRRLPLPPPHPPAGFLLHLLNLRRRQYTVYVSVSYVIRILDYMYIHM